MAEAETETVLLKCQTDLKFVYLFCQTDTFLFVIETPIRKCKHPFVLVGMSTCKTWNIKTEIYY